MIPRLLNLPQEQSFFLFGARHTGKSTLIRKQFSDANSLFIDLLDLKQEVRFMRNPGELESIVNALPVTTTHIIIDEIQKIPKLLDSVHQLLEQTSKCFILTGSSARKLKHGGANLLAGRAFIYHLFPFSYLELQQQFDLEQALRWGTLPGIERYATDESKLRFLQAYAHTYLKEEIWAEHLIKNLDPFHRFLEVSAQCNGKIINYAKIARDVGVDDKTVKEYFSILEDTLIGFILPPFHHSFRKRLSLKPKFYYFDLGVTRALSHLLSVPLMSSTSAYGEAFEHFVILECVKLAQYFYPEYRFSYLRTKDDAEIDLVVERPGLPLLFIEIKSSNYIQQSDVSTLYRISKDFSEPCEAVCLSRDIYPKRFEHINVLPWQQGIKNLFTPNRQEDNITQIELF